MTSHCPNGHERTPENTYKDRSCRLCKLARAAEREARKRAPCPKCGGKIKVQQRTRLGKTHIYLHCPKCQQQFATYGRSYRQPDVDSVRDTMSLVLKIECAMPWEKESLRNALQLRVGEPRAPDPHPMHEPVDGQRPIGQGADP